MTLSNLLNSSPSTPHMVDLNDYKSELVSDAWETARYCIEVAQNHQKTNYDRHAKKMDYRGVMV